MEANLNLFDRLVRAFLAAYFIFAAIVIYSSPAMCLIAYVLAVIVAYEAVTGWSYLFYWYHVRSVRKPMRERYLFLVGLLFIQFILAYEWLSVAMQKLLDPQFSVGIGTTLALFASNNSYVWYRNFLLGYATRNATYFAVAIEWGQLAVAVALILGTAGTIYARTVRKRSIALCFSIAALLAGALMNANFYFAVADDAYTRQLNVVMFWIQLVLVYVWVSWIIAGSVTGELWEEDARTLPRP